MWALSTVRCCWRRAVQMKGTSLRICPDHVHAPEAPETDTWPCARGRGSTVSQLAGLIQLGWLIFQQGWWHLGAGKVQSCAARAWQSEGFVSSCSSAAVLCGFAYFSKQATEWVLYRTRGHRLLSVRRSGRWRRTPKEVWSMNYWTWWCSKRTKLMAAPVRPYHQELTRKSCKESLFSGWMYKQERRGTFLVP